jgi:hypothetical protein
MMWAVRLIGSLSILAAGIICARSANDGVEGLESCFQAARVADGICSKLSNDPAKRLDCLHKTRTAQLECIEHAQSEPAPQNSSKSPSSGTPASAALAESSTEEVSSKQTGDTDTFRPSTEGNLPQESNSPPTSNPETKPLELSKQTGDTDSFRPSTESNLPQESNSPPTSNPETKPPELPARPQATIRSDLSPKPAEHPTRPTATDWVVSETTSPIDYSPLVIAVIHSTSKAKDAANTLIMRCRGQRTELLVRTDGQWATTRGSELHGEYQINDQRMVAPQWILSSDGKTATYKDDPVELLQSIPDGARFKINIPDRSSSSHEATFDLDGWDAVRKKIGTACKWRPTADNASLGKR